MKVVKKISVAIMSLIALVLIVALFVKKEYAVEKEVTIQKSNEEVFDYIKYLKNQENYSVWQLVDPEMKKDFTGADGTVGFVSAWDSENKNVGKGEQEILKIVEGKRIYFELRFIEPFEATDNAYMLTEMVDSNSTIVKWGFFGKINYPMNITMLFMDMEEMLGADLQGGLDKLKKVLEN